VDQRAYRVQSMLPWGCESRFAMGLGILKVPFILLVAFVGLKAENHLKVMTKQSWLRYGDGDASESLWKLLFQEKTGCYAHRLMSRVPSHTLLEIGVEDHDLLKSNATHDPFSLGHHPDTCTVSPRTCRVKGLSHAGYFTGGIDHLVSFAVIWLVYKLLFIGIHPIDRLALKLKGDPPPGPSYPEPLLKLLTEPYFQFCTTPMQVLVKFLFYFRYKMMPNTLLGALASMHDMSPHCPHIVYYKMSPYYGNICYFLCIVDLLSIGCAYAYVKAKMDGKLIGKWRYRIWKTSWLVSAILFAFVAVWAAFRTFGGLGSVLKAMLSSFIMLFSFSLSFKFNLDLLRVMAFTIFFFEGLELTCFVALILGPKVAPKLFEKLKPESSQYEAMVDGPRGRE